MKLFVTLAATGLAKNALDILKNASAKKRLEPIIVALRLYCREQMVF